MVNLRRRATLLAGIKHSKSRFSIVEVLDKYDLVLDSRKSTHACMHVKKKEADKLGRGEYELFVSYSHYYIGAVISYATHDAHSIDSGRILDLLNRAKEDFGQARIYCIKYIS